MKRVPWNLYWSIFRIPVENIQVSLKSDTNRGYFRWRPIYIFFVISGSFLLRMRNVTNKRCRENQNTHFVLINPPPKIVPCLCLTTLTEVFPCFFLSCKANARVKPAKTGHGPHSTSFLCCSMYCLFCVVLCIVCVYICTELLPPGGYPIAVKYIISFIR